MDHMKYCLAKLESGKYVNQRMFLTQCKEISDISRKKWVPCCICHRQRRHHQHPRHHHRHLRLLISKHLVKILTICLYITVVVYVIKTRICINDNRNSYKALPLTTLIHVWIWNVLWLNQRLYIHCLYFNYISVYIQVIISCVLHSCLWTNIGNFHFCFCGLYNVIWLILYFVMLNLLMFKTYMICFDCQWLIQHI